MAKTNFSRVRCAFGNVLQSSVTNMNFFISLQNYHYGIFALTHWGPHLHQCIEGLSFLSFLPLHIHCFFLVYFHLLLSNVYLSFLFIYLYPLLYAYKGHLHLHTGGWRSPGTSPGRSVLKIHFFIESGLKMIQFKIQFKTKSGILIQKIFIQ